MTRGIADWCEVACRDWSVGYDQSNRWAIYDGGETDCTALASWCCWQAGYTEKPSVYTYSGNIVGWLMRQGFYAVPLSDRQRNDVLVAVGHHAAIYLGDGFLGQASIDENGNISGGRSGDQGNETNIRPYYSYPWTVCLRAPDGKGDGEEEIEVLLMDDFIYQVKGGNSQKWFDGSRIHPLATPHESESVRECYKYVMKRDMPMRVLSEKQAASFEAAVKRVL